jgi:hypothetical protein
LKLEFKFGLENGEKGIKKKIKQNPANGPRISYSAQCANPQSRGPAGHPTRADRAGPLVCRSLAPTWPLTSLLRGPAVSLFASVARLARVRSVGWARVVSGYPTTSRDYGGCAPMTRSSAAPRSAWPRAHIGRIITAPSLTPPPCASP